MSWGETIYLRNQIKKQLAETQVVIQSRLQEVEGQIPVVASEDENGNPSGVSVENLTEGNTWFIVEGDEGE
jgi:hypothetical protein